MVFFIDEARSRPPPFPRLLTNVNKKMVFVIEGFPKFLCEAHRHTLKTENDDKYFVKLHPITINIEFGKDYPWAFYPI